MRLDGILKRIVVVALVVALTVSCGFEMNASEIQSVVCDSASYTESQTGDIITIEEIRENSITFSEYNDKSEIYTTQISRNGVLEETLMVDWDNDELTHVYPDGTVFVERLSSIVTVKYQDETEIEEMDSESVEVHSDNKAMLQAKASIDYIANEPFELDENGYQISLDGTYIYTGYRSMGCRGNYSFAPDLYGYLQRMDAGLYGTYYSHMFEFSAGTQIGTAASIIVAFFTGSGWGLVLSLVTACLGAVIDFVMYDWDVNFQIRRYLWNYDVRLNSDYGAIIYETYRTKDYVRAYEPDTGKMYLEYLGKSYNTGYGLENWDMIEDALAIYVAQNQ